MSRCTRMDAKTKAMPRNVVGQALPHDSAHLHVSGAAASITSSNGETTTLGHTPGGRVSRIDTSEGGVSLVHDLARGEITQIQDQDGNPLVSYATDAFGRTTSMTTPDSTVELDHDALGGAYRIRSSVNGTTEWRHDADDLVTVFILPPSGEALETRLQDRAQDSEDVVKRRMAGASNEIQHWEDYEYVVVNADADQAVEELRSILAAERLKRTRRTGLRDFVRQVQSEL